MQARKIEFNIKLMNDKTKTKHIKNRSNKTKIKKKLKTGNILFVFFSSFKLTVKKNEIVATAKQKKNKIKRMEHNRFELIVKCNFRAMNS